MTIHERLTWNEHILAIINKARQLTGFLRQNFYQCLPHVKCYSNLYKSVIHPIINFVPLVWDPHTISNNKQTREICIKILF